MWKSDIFEIHISLDHTSISWFIPEYILYIRICIKATWLGGSRIMSLQNGWPKRAVCADRRLKRPEALRVFKSSHILVLITSPISAEFCQTNVSIFSLQGKSAMNILEVRICIYLRKQKVTDFSQRERWTCFTMTGSALIAGPSFFPGLNSGCLAARVLLVAHCSWKFLISFWIL